MPHHHPVELDYPCSWSFRQFEAWQNGENLPDIDPPSKGENEIPESPKGLGYSSLLNQMEQLKGAMNYLEKRINEHIDASKRKRKGYW